MKIILTSYLAKNLLQAREANQEITLGSIDLNLSTTQIGLNEQGIFLLDGTAVDWASIEDISKEEHRCFLWEDGKPQEIKAFSNITRLYRSMYSTKKAPTVAVSGAYMHRVKGMDPIEDTYIKLNALGRISGKVLDTATGLGYTAIEAAKYASEVITIEIDPVGIEIAKINPWSQKLFDNPKIKQMIGDTSILIRDFDDAIFSVVIHDPPTFSLAGQLYSGEFYKHLYRVLKPKGKVFHYIGDPMSASGGKVTPGVIRRLHEAGFVKVLKKPEAFGVLALK